MQGFQDMEESIRIAQLALNATPEDHHDRAHYVNNLAVYLRDRFSGTKEPKDLEEAIQLGQLVLNATPDDHPDRAGRLYGVGRFFRNLFSSTGDLRLLEEAIRFGQLALDATPKDHLGYAERLNNLGVYFRERFSRIGDNKDLEEAIRLAQLALGVTPNDDPNRAHYLNNLGVYLRNQFLRTGETGPLEEAIRLGQMALDITPENHPNRAERLSNMGGHFQQRFLRIGEIGDLEKAIGVGKLVLDATPENHPNRGQRLNDLSTRFRDRFSRIGDINDLEESIRLGQLALNATPKDHPDYAERLNNVGNYFQKRFLRSGELRDLAEAIRLEQLALDATPEGHPDRGHHLSNLGSVLSDRFSRFGDLDDLEESIKLGQLALDVTPRDHPDRARRLNNLGTRFRDRFLRIAELTDLEEAIRFGQLALDSVPEDHLDRGCYLNNLGLYLSRRFSRKGDLSDLEEAIRLGRLALDTISDEHPSRTIYLNNLGIYLSDRFSRFGDLHDLEESIKLGQLALDATPRDHPDRARRLNYLGTRFRDRFLRKAELTDLEEAILFGQLALDSVPEDHPDREYYLNNLGTRFGDRFTRKGERKDIDESTRYFRQSLHHPSGTPLARVTAGISAAKNLVQLSDWRESAVSFQEALNLFPKVTPRTSSRQDLQHTLQQLSGSASLAASVFLKAGRSPLEALQILEQGRGVIAGLVVDSRSDVSSLREMHPDLYLQYTRLREIVATPLLPELSPDDISSQAMTLRDSYALRSSQRYKSAADLDEVLENIRQQPGFNGFQLPPTGTEIVNLAASGPLVSFNISEISAEAFIITTFGVQVLQLPSLKKIDLKSAISFLSDRGNSNRRDVKIVSETGETGTTENERRTSVQTVSSQMFSLWKNAVKPVLNRLGLLEQTNPSARLPRIWWIGGGLIANLPLHAAGKHLPGSTENTLSHVVSNFAPSLKSLQFTRSKTWRSLKDQDHKILVVSMPKTPGFPGYISVAEEVREIKSKVGTQGSVITLEQPSKFEVLEQFQSCTIAHFACHGRVDDLEPAKSALLLGKTSLEELTIRDLDAINHPHAQIAYLSACSTAEVRSYDLVDESIHLASTFILAGFPHVIGTLWGAQDSAAVEVAREFYKKLFQYSEDENASVAYALHEAVLCYRNADENVTDILKWAPFIHIGS
jgi:tetratricopeptide (TPR) repeat protein